VGAPPFAAFAKDGKDIGWKGAPPATLFGLWDILAQFSGIREKALAT